MGRVEKRMYKRRQQRSKKMRILGLMVILTCVAVAIWHRLPDSFKSEHIGLPTPTPVTSAFDRSTGSREVILAEETWYAIQTGVFSTQEAAAQKADAYTKRGAPGTVVQDGDKWRVFIACYGTEEQAASVRTRLEQNQKVDTYLYAWKCPELRLRLSGMVGQMDVVEAGFTLMVSTASAMRDAAINLDAGENTTAETITAVETMCSQISLWEDTTCSRFGKSMPDMVQGMLSITRAWAESIESMQTAPNATELSASLKAQAMNMYDDIIAWRSALAAQ